MGVRHLRRHLEPYAQRKTLNNERVIIDGPALAYHIIHLCMKDIRSDSLFKQPSYKLLGETAVSWLDQLQACGITILAIYFDGFLPTAKIPERVGRFWKVSKELQNYALSYPTGIPQRLSLSQEQAAVELFPVSSLGTSHQKPPIPPFAVPAIMEALKSHSRYAAVVNVVPAEADVFCARRARSDGGIVLTSDSDLLVHPLGPHGSVVFFDDIETASEVVSTLICRQYQASHICKKLSLESGNCLTGLAFELSMDEHTAFDEVVRKAKSKTAMSRYPEEFSNFIAPYSQPEVGQQDCAVHLLGSDPRVSEALLRMFPRMSILASTLTAKKSTASLDSMTQTTATFNPPVSLSTPQTLTASTVSTGEYPGLAETSKQCEFRMFLPNLLGCHSRTSAWEPSKRIRSLVYGLPQLAIGRSISSAVEFRRLQAPSQGGTRVTVCPVSDIGNECNHFSNLITSIQSALAEPDMAWVVLSIHEDIEMTLQQSKHKSLSFQVLRVELMGALDQSSWDYIHFVAQLQATYYSLRILQQVLGFIISYLRAREQECPDAVITLHRIVCTSLPSLSCFPSFGDFSALLQRVRKVGGMAWLVTADHLPKSVREQFMLIQNPPVTPEQAMRRRRKVPNAPRDSGRSKRPPVSGFSPVSQSNRFALLPPE